MVFTDKIGKAFTKSKGVLFGASLLASAVVSPFADTAEAASFKKITLPRDYDFVQMKEEAEKASEKGAMAVLIHSEDPKIRQAVYEGFKGFAMAVAKAEKDPVRRDKLSFAVIFGNDTDSNKNVTTIEYFVSSYSAYEFIAMNVDDYDRLTQETFEGSKIAAINFKKALENAKSKDKLASISPDNPQPIN